MLVPFRKETMTQERFLRDQVRFNLLHRISEGELATALQAEDGGAVALQNQGRGLMLWIDREQGDEYAAAVTRELAEVLSGSNLPGFMAEPTAASLFFEAYGQRTGAQPELVTRLMAYACPGVKWPRAVPGAFVRADEAYIETVAGLRAGFTRELFGAVADREMQLKDAETLIRGGGMYLWNAEGNSVGMAAIGHRSAGHARLNNVYTMPDARRLGYASALVARVSQLVLDEGLVPMLYADADYPASNRTYLGIGYVPAGEVNEYRFVYTSQ